MKGFPSDMRRFGRALHREGLAEHSGARYFNEREDGKTSGHLDKSI